MGRLLDALGPLSETVSSPVLATILVGFMERTHRDPRVAGEAFIAELFDEVKPVLLRNLIGNHQGLYAVSTVFLEQYFAHRGNWPKMRASLERALAAYPEDVLVYRRLERDFKEAEAKLLGGMKGE